MSQSPETLKESESKEKVVTSLTANNFFMNIDEDVLRSFLLPGSGYGQLVIDTFDNIPQFGWENTKVLIMAKADIT